jgi:hypothetical protein
MLIWDKAQSRSGVTNPCDRCSSLGQGLIVCPVDRSQIQPLHHGLAEFCTLPPCRPQACPLESHLQCRQHHRLPIQSLMRPKAIQQTRSVSHSHACDVVPSEHGVRAISQRAMRARRSAKSVCGLQAGDGRGRGGKWRKRRGERRRRQV